MTNALAHILCLLFLIRSASVYAKIPCNSDFGVKIDDGEVLDNGAILKDDIAYQKTNYVEGLDGGKIGCVCNLKTCLRKCCPFGEYLVNKTCGRTDREFVIPDTRRSADLGDYHVVFGSQCEPEKSRLLLDPRNDSESNDAFVLQPDGRLHLISGNYFYEATDYCVDYIEELDEIQALLCSRSFGQDFAEKYTYYDIGNYLN